MRDMTREKAEKTTSEKGVTLIDLAICEEGTGHARETMDEVTAGDVSNKKPPLEGLNTYTSGERASRSTRARARSPSSPARSRYR